MPIEDIITLPRKEPPQVPAHWLEAVLKLHPISAIVFWQVMTDTLTPETITLATYSPEYSKYTFLRAVGGGNPEFLKDVADIARGTIELGTHDLFSKPAPGSVWH
jgi:hypothetical protein